MRGSLLYSLFYLAALISYILYLKGDYKRRYLVIAFFLYICSLLSKSAAVVLPLSMLAADYYLRRKIDFACIAEKVPFFLLSLGFGALTIYFREDAGHIWSPYAFTWLDNLFFISYAIWGYVYKLFLPINLSAFYGYPVKINGLLPATFYLSPLFLAVVIWCAHRAKKYRREIIFGILFFLVNIVLVVKIVPLGTEIACDRYVYIPHIGTLFILGCILSDLIRAGSKARIILFTLITIIVILLSVISYGRITVWKDAITRYDDILNNDPNVYMAYYNRAVAKKGVNDLYGALADYNRAIELYPNERIYDNRGNVKYDLKDYQGAMNDYTKSIEVQANNYAAYNNRANAKVKLQDYAGALADFNRALELYPAYADAYGNRAGLKALQGDIGGAISDYDKAINMNPNYDRAYFKRGNSRLALKDYEGAISDYSAALSLKPDADSYWNRGNAKIAVKDYAGAIADYEAALNYNPGNVSILFNLGWGRWLYGDKAGACADWNRAYEFGRKDTANVLKQFCVINR
jgi:tetratricopeptide (TPR) repeat protein